LKPLVFLTWRLHWARGLRLQGQPHYVINDPIQQSLFILESLLLKKYLRCCSAEVYMDSGSPCNRWRTDRVGAQAPTHQLSVGAQVPCSNTSTQPWYNMQDFPKQFTAAVKHEGASNHFKINSKQKVARVRNCQVFAQWSHNLARLTNFILSKLLTAHAFFSVFQYSVARRDLHRQFLFPLQITCKKHPCSVEYYIRSRDVTGKSVTRDWTHQLTKLLSNWFKLKPLLHIFQKTMVHFRWSNRCRTADSFSLQRIKI